MNNEQVSQLIERIVYLTSLASRRQDVEQFADTLSMITARWSKNEAMSEGDQKQLQSLEDEIKLYLVTKDPLRSFTLESLEQRVVQKPGHAIVRPISEFGGIIATSLAVGLVAFALSFWIDLQAGALLCVGVFFIALHVGIAWLYRSALKNFRSDFRQAYVYLGVSAVLLSIGFTHYVVINLLQLDRYAAFQYGGVTWLIALPFVLMYLGLRKYARLLQINTLFASLALAGCAAMATALVLVVLPHRAVAEPLYFHIWTVGAWMLPIFALLSSVLANKIRRVVTAAYSRSMTWLYYYTLAVGLGSVLAGGALFWLGGLYGERLAAVIAICGLPPQLVLLYAAYSFKKETSK